MADQKLMIRHYHTEATGMDELHGQPPWTEQQWALLQSTATDAARRSRVASSFLPLVGPLPSSVTTVPALGLDENAPPTNWPAPVKQRLSVDDSRTLVLSTIAAEVYLTGPQVADPDLAAAREMIARAAVILGRVEDAMVLVGQPGIDSRPTTDFTTGGPMIVKPEIYRVSGGGKYPGLARLHPASSAVPVTGATLQDQGNSLVGAVADAVDKLEGAGQFGPFAAFLGSGLYKAAHSPSPSLVMPADQFVPFLGGGPLLRSSVLDQNEGVVVASAGAPIELVIAEDLHISYVQRTIEPRYVLRLCERLVLRVRQPSAAILLAV
jgi:uncharacterized linocin/CFP29 family protein